MDKSSLLKAFNNHFTEFIADVKRVFPNDLEIATTEVALNKLKKANPKLTIVIFKDHVVSKYSKQIEAGDLEFFISKDYSEDLSSNDKNNVILNKIDALRRPVSLMTPKDQSKVIKYLQNLKKLADMYFT